MTKRKVNYTNAQVEEMVEMYSAAATEDERQHVIEVLANGYHKSKLSIIAKLRHLGIYIPPEKKEKTAKPKPTTRAELATAVLASMLSEDYTETDVAQLALAARPILRRLAIASGKPEAEIIG